MSNVQEDLSVSLADAATLIQQFGEYITYLCRGRPGIGKSSMLGMLEEALGDGYEYRYIDCTRLVDGDLGIYVPDRETGKMSRMLPDVLFPESGKPVVVMFDEYLKMDRRVKKQCSQVGLEHRLDNKQMTAGSIVLCTSNLASDSVNDVIEAHEGNRLTELVVRGPTASEWNVWATNNGVTARTRTWVAMNPTCMQSYEDEGAEDNPFIFNPRKSGSNYTFVSPRSLVKADIQLRKNIPARLIKPALAGTVGRPAAESMSMFFEMEKDLVDPRNIFKDPDGTSIPDSAAIVLMTYFKAVDMVDTQDELAALMQWSNRCGRRDLQGVLFTMLCQSKRTMKMALRNTEVATWSKANYELVI